MNRALIAIHHLKVTVRLPRWNKNNQQYMYNSHIPILHQISITRTNGRTSIIKLLLNLFVTFVHVTTTLKVASKLLITF